MIAFACHCKHRFSLPDDQAGGVIQCPDCGRLNDVPTLDDLPHLDADGVFDIYADRPTDDPSRLAELGIVYAKGERDADGDEIDLRGSVASSNPDTIPIAGEEEIDEKPRPKYDPETGELIRPLELREDSNLARQAIPLAQTVIQYATPAAEFRRISPWRILVELFAPGNVLVMAFVFLTCMLLVITAAIVNYGLVFLVVAPLLFAGMLVAHFAITVEEIGPLEQDELPRMLRNFSWHEDLWGPFKRMVGSLLLAFWPIVLARYTSPTIAFLLIAIGGVIGLCLLPAILLTMLTSGTILNLRPDRLMGVIEAAGARYVVAVAGGALSLATTLIGLFGTSVWVWNGMSGQSVGGWLPKWFVCLPLLLAGIYFAHAWAWYLGLIYRAHHGQFRWVLQRHISTRLTSLDPATDYQGRAQKPRKTTASKLRDIREQGERRAAPK